MPIRWSITWTTDSTQPQIVEEETPFLGDGETMYGDTMNIDNEGEGSTLTWREVREQYSARYQDTSLYWGSNNDFMWTEEDEALPDTIMIDGEEYI